MKKLLPIILALLLLCGCGENPATAVQPSGEGDAGTSSQQTPSTDSAQTAGDEFSDRDYKTDYDNTAAAVITLSGSTAQCTSNAVRISGSTVTVTDEGTYIISGTLDNGMIIVDSEKTDKTQLVLNGVNITSGTSAAIYVRQSDKVFITLGEGSENILTNGGSFENIDDSNIDAVIFSKEDITLNGSGRLEINSPAGHGIVSKDELTVTGGTYVINTASHGIAGKDNVCIGGGTFTVSSGKDGIHAENSEDASLGYVYIEQGSFDITAEGDGISASAYMQIEDGTFAIVCGGGAANGAKQTSSNWGGFMGGRGGFGGQTGGFSASTDTSEDSTSIKGIKATGDMRISGGSFKIDSADDAIHSNACVTVAGGTFDIATGDDGFHADDTLTVTAGQINISQSYEGLEGLHIAISGGDISLVSSDDGLNAAGGTDQSGTGGVRGGDKFGGKGGFGGMSGSSSSGTIVISGGKLYAQASGDGIDANGTLEISAGHITVCGPTSGDTAVLDYDRSAVISGGTFIGTGSTMMAQVLSSSAQGVLAINAGNQQANTLITVTDNSGKVVIEHQPQLPFAMVMVSSPGIVKGQNYTITVGANSAAFTAN